MHIESIGDYTAKWGEGAIWWGDHLLYVDIEGEKVIKVNPETGEESFFQIGQRVGFIVPRVNGGFLIGADDGIFSLSEEGSLEALDNPEADKLNNRFNDGKCSPDGFLFAGTISLVKKEGDASLYRFDDSLKCHPVESNVTNSNGLAWSLDGATLYYIDTPQKEVWAYDYDQGRISNRRIVIKTDTIEGSPDGMCIDANGNLWVAFCHGSCVTCFDPSDGTIVRTIELPCLETTSCTFGGKNLDELYVTTGIHKTEKEPLAGKVLKITNLDAKGVSAFSYKK